MDKRSEQKSLQALLRAKNTNARRTQEEYIESKYFVNKLIYFYQE